MNSLGTQAEWNRFGYISQPLKPPPPNTNAAWQVHVNDAWRKFDSTFGTDGSIKAGTQLFHGSLDPNFDLFNLRDANRPVFFGLDPYIAIWYVYEQAAWDWRKHGRGFLSSVRPKKYFSQARPQKRQKSRRKRGKLGPCNGIGYLYVYQLTSDIPASNVRRLLRLQDNPKDDAACFGRKSDMKTVCVHPQIAYHGFAPGAGPTAPLQDISFELTLRPSEYVGSIEQTNKWMVNILDLHLNEDEPKYDALAALVPLDPLVPDDCKSFLERERPSLLQDAPSESGTKEPLPSHSERTEILLPSTRTEEVTGGSTRSRQVSRRQRARRVKRTKHRTRTTKRRRLRRRNRAPRLIKISS